ncbi:MAG: hypothetical protein KAI66_10855 [Lentisphaeria bacterium]|nr:hypothetical protein [Lentisphaeria bacterium]
MKVFCLLLVMAAGCMAAGPIVFWTSDPVRPNETVLVAGSGFGDGAVVELVSLAAERGDVPSGALVWPPGVDVVKVKPLQSSNESLKFVLPAESAVGVWLLRVRTKSDAVSPPARLNAPSVYWLQGDAGRVLASPGGWVRVFGRCMRLGESDPALLLLSKGGNRKVELVLDRLSPWHVRGKLPSDLALGEWKVFVHNGFGGPAGWMHAGQITVARREQWPRKVFNVRDFGAQGQGGYEDVSAIQAALDAAGKNGGGVVYLPRGRYLFEGTLELPKRTVLRGENRSLVSINWPDTTEPYTLVKGSDHFGVEDLTLYASNYRHAIEGDIRVPTAGHCFVRRVTLRAVIYRGHLKPEQVDERFRASLKLSSGGGDTIRLGGENIEVTDCDLYGSGRALLLFGVRGGVVSNNRFYNGRWGWYCITGADGLAFENNVLTGADLMSTGGGINCLGSVYSENVYYAGNTIARCHGWDREAMTSDAGGGPYHGPVGTVDGVMLVLPEPVNWRGGPARWTGAAVFILGGTGMGQHRRIVHVADDRKTITLDRAWTVEPEVDSVITVTMMQCNYLFIDNHFEDAGIALQYYGTSVNHVASGNTSTRCGGFYNSGRWYHGYQPSWFCQFLDNEILDGNCYRFGANNATDSGPSYLGTYGLQVGENSAPLAYCTVHRRNHLHNNALIRVLGVSEEHPGVRDIVIEHNTVENADVGIHVDAGCVGVLQRGNVFKNVVQKQYDPEANRARRMALRTKLLNQKEPVFHASFEKRNGRFVPEVSGNAFTGTVTSGEVIFEQGLKGQAAHFDGKGYIQVHDRALLRFPKTTISAWILPDQIRGRWGVMAKRDRNGATAFVLAIREGGVTFEGTDVKGKWTYNYQSKPVVREGQWTHVAATCEEGKVVRVYCDGEMVGQRKVDAMLVDNQYPLTIGFEAWGGEDTNPRASGNFMGLIDEVKIWSRILSDAELKSEWSSLAGQADMDSLRRKRDAIRLAEETKKLEQELKLPSDSKWRLIAATAFEGTKIPQGWTCLRGGWKIKDGTLQCSSVSFLALDRKLSLPVRIEYDARSADPSDLSAFFGTKADTYSGGYFIGFASNGNQENKILRLGEEVARTGKPNAVPGKWHHVVCEIDVGGEVRLGVDGHPVLSYSDPKPVVSADTAGVLAWGKGEFDNIRIFTGKK